MILPWSRGKTVAASPIWILNLTILNVLFCYLCETVYILSQKHISDDHSDKVRQNKIKQNAVVVSLHCRDQPGSAMELNCGLQPNEDLCHFLTVAFRDVSGVMLAGWQTGMPDTKLIQSGSVREVLWGAAHTNLYFIHTENTQWISCNVKC